MKNILKVLALILVAVQIIPMLVACNPSGSGDGTTADPNDTSVPGESTDSETTGETLPVLGDGFVTVFNEGKYNFISIKYPEEPGTVIFSAVTKLRDRLKEETGKQIDASPDYSTDKRPPDSSTLEILIGQTNYPESKEALASISYGDYIITVIDNKLVITAYTENELFRAVNYITGTMFKNTITEDEAGNKTIIINEYTFLAEKKLDKITIEGNDLSEYSIVYGTTDTSGANLATATALQQKISESSKYMLPIIKDTDECTTKRKIYIGASFNGLDASVKLPEVEPMHYKSVVIGDDFYIVGGALLSTYLGVAEIMQKNLIQTGTAKEINITASEASFLKCASQPLSTGAEFRVMTYNIMAQWTNWGGDYMPVAQRFEGFKSIIDAYSPDVVGLQEVSEHWSNMILDVYGDTYAYIHQKTPDGKFINLSTIIYKKDKFDVVDQGLKYFTYNGPNQIRLVNWVILKDKATGKQFAFFNTHWMFYSDVGNDAERKSHSEEHVTIMKDVLAAHPDVKYAFTTGDYNTVLTHEYCIKFLADAGLVNSLDIAKKSGNLINEVGGCGTLGVSRLNNTGGGSIDNIFVTPNMKVLRHETVLWNGAEHISDHSAKYADIVLE